MKNPVHCVNSQGELIWDEPVNLMSQKLMGWYTFFKITIDNQYIKSTFWEKGIPPLILQLHKHLKIN